MSSASRAARYISELKVETSRCPKAKLIGSARLPEHTLLINQRGYASITAAQNRVVHGLLWTLTEADEKTLDRYEGVSKGLYRKVVFSVEQEQGAAAIEALVDVASDNVYPVKRGR